MKRLLLALLLLCVALPAAAAPPAYVGKIGEVVDPAAAPNVSSLTVSVTVSAGSDRALVISVSPRSSSVTVTSCVFNGTESATFLDFELNGLIRQEVWGLLNPTVTTANVVCTFTGNVPQSRMTVHQYTGVSAFGAANNLLGTSANPNVSLTTTAADSVVFAGVFDGAQTASPFAPESGTTERTDGTTGTDATADRSFTDLEKTAGAAGIYSVGTETGTSAAWSAVAVELKAVSAGGSTGPGMWTLLGVGRPGTTTPPPVGDCNIEMAAGSTDAQIIAAILSAPDGSEICLQAGESVLVSQEIDIDLTSRSLTINCRGSTLVRNFDGVMIDMFGAEVGTSAFTVSGNTITWTTLPSGIAAGSWIKVTADDDLPGGSHGVSASGQILPVGFRNRLGQQLQVNTVSGSATTFNGTLQHSGSYATNRRANLIQSKDGVIKDCRILGNSAQTTWEQPSIVVRDAVAPLVQRVAFVNGLNGGLVISNTAQARGLNLDCRNLGTNTLLSNVCVDIQSSVGTQVSGNYGDNTRALVRAQGVDIAASAISLSNYGAVWSSTISDSVCNAHTTNACLDMRSEARAPGISAIYGFASGAFMNIRGRDGVILDSFGIGLANAGIRLVDDVGGASVAGDDGSGWLFDRVTVRENVGSAIISQNSPTNNRFCSGRLESNVGAFSGFTPSQNLSSCTYVSGVLTTFNTNVASNVASTQDNFACATCGDILPAGAGADTIDALGGDDLIWGGAGNDTITLGAGRDRLAYFWTDEGSDTVSDFVVGSSGDIIDISWFVARAAGAHYTGDPLADGYARVQQSGGDTLVQLDADGGGNNYVTVATLTGVTAANVAAANWRNRLISE